MYIRQYISRRWWVWFQTVGFLIIFLGEVANIFFSVSMTTVGLHSYHTFQYINPVCTEAVFQPHFHFKLLFCAISIFS